MSRARSALRATVLLLGLATTSGCAEAGPDAAWAQVAISDSVEARRVHFDTLPQYLDFSGPSPDGRLIAGSHRESGDLMVTSLDGSVRRLAPGVRSEPWGSPGFTEAARFSRDGRLIVYRWWDIATTRYELRVIAASGGEPHVVHAGDYPVPMDWSPDGRWIAVSDLTADRTWRILVVPAEGGEPKLVRALDWREPAGVAFSPDGRWLAYDGPTSDEALEHDLFVYHIGSGRERAVLQSPAHDAMLGWSPDGTLLFRSDRSGAPGAWRVGMREGRPGGAPVLVKPDFWRASPVGFTAAGDFYYAVETGGLVIRSAALDPRTGLAGAPDALTTAGESVSPDGTPRGAVTPDGRLLVFQVGPGDGHRGVVLRLRPVQGGEARDVQLPAGITRAHRQRWLPDGSAVLFAGSQDGRDGLFRLDTRSGQVERLLDQPALGSQGAQFVFDVTPDGKSLVFRRRDNPDGRAHLVVRDLASGAERVLAAFEWEPLRARAAGRLIEVSPDGRRVAWFRGREAREGSAGRVDLVVSPLGLGAEQVIEEAGGDAETVQGMVWTGDGSGVFVSRSGAILRVPLDGGSPVDTGLEGTPIRADASGTRLIFQDRVRHDRHDPAELWMLSLGSGR